MVEHNHNNNYVFNSSSGGWLQNIIEISGVQNLSEHKKSGI